MAGNVPTHVSSSPSSFAPRPTANVMASLAPTTLVRGSLRYLRERLAHRDAEFAELDKK